MAGALAALELLAEQPQRVEKLQANGDALRDELAREGFEVAGSTTQIVPLVIGDAKQAMRICELAIERGVFAQAIRPPTVPEGTSRLRLAVMASHSRAELREAAQVLGRAALQAGWRPGEGVPVAAAREAAAAPSDGPVRHRAPGRVGALALARPLRHRHRHGRRQDGPRRGAGRGAAGGWRRRGRVQAGGDGPRRAREATTGRPRAARAAAGRPVDEVAPHRFGPPVSPHLAAELAGTTLDPAALVAHARGLRADVVVAEGVGGLLVPLTLGYTVRDLAVDLDWPVVVAARPASAPSTTRSSRSSPRAPPASTCAR